MAYIRLVSDDEADGTLQRVYEAAKRRASKVSQIVRLMSQDSPSLQGSMAFYVSLMKRSNALEPARREMLATVVSNANNCFY